MGLPLFSVDTGPVRPIGKAANYDNTFEKLLEDIEPACNQGIVEVISTYNISPSTTITLGGVDTGGYPLDVGFVVGAYRSMAGDQKLLAGVIDSTVEDLIRDPANHETLNVAGQADRQINDLPSSPLVELGLMPDDIRELVTQIARSRIGSLVKHTGYCEAKDLVPTFLLQGHCNAIDILLGNISSLLNHQQQDAFWSRRCQILDLAFQTILTPNSLENLSIQEILRFRTRNWGRLEKERADLFSGAFELANDSVDASDFRRYVSEALTRIRDTAASVEAERAALGFKVKCATGEALLLAGLSIKEAQVPLSSYSAMLAVGGIWALNKLEGCLDNMASLKQHERQARRGVGYSMSKYIRTVGSI